MEGVSSLENEIQLDIKNITKLFPGTRALNNVSFSIRKGEMHALVGENGAGKSTLMNIIGGVLQPDGGHMEFDGESVVFDTPEKSQHAGIGFVHQEMSLCPHMSVAENVYIGRLPKTSIKTIDKNRLYSNCQKQLDMFHCHIKPNDLVSGLNVAEQQIVEIVKAMSLQCKLLILDEPTSSLTETETEVLFKILFELKDKGVSIVYISHRMEEIFKLCDRVSILKDGEYMGTMDVKDTTTEKIINLMVGRNINNLYPEKNKEKAVKEILRVENLTSAKKLFSDISFSLHEGEILGFAGLIGSGRTEVMRAICGIDPIQKGTIYLKNKQISNKSYMQSIKNGIGYLTEDRKTLGLFLRLNVVQNVSAANLFNLKKGLLMDGAKEAKISDEYVDRLKIKVPHLKVAVQNLSGGNQQKVMIAKWLSIKPQIIIMDEPTRGVDVGAKAEIHSLLRELVKSGIGVIVVSSELPEIIGMSDRVLVMHEGRITGEVFPEEMHESTIMTYASGTVK